MLCVDEYADCTFDCSLISCNVAKICCIDEMCERALNLPVTNGYRHDDTVIFADCCTTICNAVHCTVLKKKKKK